MTHRSWLTGAALSVLGAPAACHSPEPGAAETRLPAKPAKPSASDSRLGRSAPADPRSAAPPPGDPTTADAPTEAPGSGKNAEPPPEAAARVIYLVQLGEPLEASPLEDIAGALALFFPAPVRVFAPQALPRAAFYPPRSRYRAEKLLDALAALTPSDAQVMVGLTKVDISTTKGPHQDWGILGLATLSGRECVISEFRAKRGAQGPLHVRERLMKTVVHEVGHTIGLDHCPNYGCIMEDGKGSVTTTDHEFDICPTCREEMGSKLLSPPAHYPWSRP